MQRMDSGRWLIQLDINNDGVVDIELSSEQAGHKPIPSGFIDPVDHSGLTIYTDPASAQSNRFVRAPLTLGYKESLNEPFPSDPAQLKNQRPVVVPIPTSSAVSPAFVEGRLWDATRSIAASLHAPTFIGNTQFFANIPMDPNAATPVSFSQSGTPPTTVNGAIEWTATDLTGHEGSEVEQVRTGDSLLLTAQGGSGALTYTVTLPNQTTETIAGGSSHDPTPYRFDLSGNYAITAKLNGIAVGTIMVTAISVDLSKPIACEVGFTSNKNVSVHRFASVPNVTFGSGDPSQLTVYTAGTFSNADGTGAALKIKPLMRGFAALTARIKGISGPIVAYIEIDEFTRFTRAKVDVFVNDESGFGDTEFVIRPYIPGLRFEFNMFASKSSFMNGLKLFSINTSDGAHSQNAAIIMLCQVYYYQVLAHFLGHCFRR